MPRNYAKKKKSHKAAMITIFIVVAFFCGEVLHLAQGVAGDDDRGTTLLNELVECRLEGKAG